MNRAHRLIRALPTLLRVGFAETIAYRGEFLIWMLSTTMPIIMLLLWSAVAKEQPIGRFGEAEFGAYFLTTLVVRLITGAWVVWEMNYEIRQGTIAMRLLRPLHPFIAYAAENLAAVPFRLLLSLPVGLGAYFWLGTKPFSSDIFQWALLPASLFGAWLITFSLMAMIGTLALFWESAVGMFHLYLGFFFILSGYTIPLKLFPSWFLTSIQWLPFRFQLSFPVELVVGMLSRGQTITLLGVQWLYAMGLTGISLVLWKIGLRRYSAYGG